MAISDAQRAKLDKLEKALAGQKKGTSGYNRARDAVVNFRSEIGARTASRGGTSSGSGSYLGTAQKDFNKAIGGDNLDTAKGGIQGQLAANNLSSLQSFLYGNPNESGPFGGVTNRLNDDGSVTRTTSLSPGQQAINDEQEHLDMLNLQGAGWMRNQVGEAFQNRYDLSGVPQVPGQNDLLGERKRVEDSLYNDFSRRMDPQMQKQRSDLEAQLINEGQFRGSPRFDRAMQDLDRQQQDARLTAQTQATSLGGQEMASNFGMGLQGRQQGISEYEARRYAPLNEMQGLLGSVRGVMQPNVTPYSPVSAGNVDVAGTYLGYENQALQEKIANKPVPHFGGGAAAPAGRSWNDYSSMISNRNGTQIAGQQVQNQPRYSGWTNIGNNVGQGIALGGVGKTWKVR